MNEVKEYGNGYNSNNSIAIIWSIEDVKNQLEILNEDMPEKVDLELTDDDCMEVLSFVESKHDANYGIGWENFYTAIQYCFEDEINELKEVSNG
tara:strand:- start:40 stop:321 length:282 start_codon:yes stop_codon:yes gene_type:complete